MVLEDLAVVGAEYLPAGLPYRGEDGLLDGDLAGEPVEAVADQPSALPAAIMSIAAVNATRSSGRWRAASGLGEHADDAVVVAPGPGSNLAVLVGQRNVGADLPAGAHSGVAEQPRRGLQFLSAI